jgi:hypothetical protein
MVKRASIHDWHHEIEENQAWPDTFAQMRKRVEPIGCGDYRTTY